MAAKVEIQIRFISKHHVNDYISTISKNYFDFLVDTYDVIFWKT